MMTVRSSTIIKIYSGTHQNTYELPAFAESHSGSLAQPSLRSYVIVL